MQLQSTCCHSWTDVSGGVCAGFRVWMRMINSTGREVTNCISCFVKLFIHTLFFYSHLHSDQTHAKEKIRMRKNIFLCDLICIGYNLLTNFTERALDKWLLTNTIEQHISKGEKKRFITAVFWIKFALKLICSLVFFSFLLSEDVIFSGHLQTVEKTGKERNKDNFRKQEIRKVHHKRFPL